MERIRALGKNRNGLLPPAARWRAVLEDSGKRLVGRHKQVLVGKLGERLAFERTGVRRYSALITKLEVHPEEAAPVTAELLRHIRTEELAHFALLVHCLQQLGADPTVPNPWGDIASLEATGLMKVITDARTSFTEALHAVLMGELTDTACWEELVLLAEAEGLPGMTTCFRDALGQEQEHLATVREWLRQLMFREASTNGGSRTASH